jgi:hypothetical protein
VIHLELWRNESSRMEICGWKTPAQERALLQRVKPRISAHCSATMFPHG